MVSRYIVVLDVSEANDWTMVRVWYGPVFVLGRPYAVSGFMYEGGAVAVVDAAGQEEVAQAVGDAAGAEGDEGLDALVIHGEAASPGVARGLELEFLVGVEPILVERGAEGLRELSPGGAVR